MTSTLQPVTFRGRLAAAATPDRFYLAPHIEVLEADHPDRVFVSLMCCHARDVLVGIVNGPYDTGLAELTVRTTLIDDREFGTRLNDSDAALAERYAVPLDQIAEKRRDLDRLRHTAPERPYV